MLATVLVVSILQLASGRLQGSGAPEPFLDFDFARDSNNPLEVMYPKPHSGGTTAPAIANSTIATEEVGNATTAPPAAMLIGAGPNGTSPNVTSPNVTSNSTQRTTTAAPPNVTSTAAPTVTGQCVTRNDTRINAWSAETAPEGTQCVFGVDVRDEGSHCIYDNGQFGSNGWCFTKQDKLQWGSCAVTCPLYGPHAQLGKKIDTMAKAVGKISARLDSDRVKSTTAAPLAATTAAAQPAAAVVPPGNATAAAEVQFASATSNTSLPAANTTAEVNSSDASKAKSNASDVGVNVTEVKKEANHTLCVTIKDPRISAWLSQTAPEGTPCIFGVDVRDEGSHCLFENGQFGSNGWCFTKRDRSEWGSCGSMCPLYGPPAQLGKKIEKVANAVGRIAAQLNAAKSTAAPVQTTGTTTAAPAAKSTTASTPAAATAAPAPKASLIERSVAGAARRRRRSA